jgi:predicted nucleotidyltransferase
VSGALIAGTIIIIWNSDSGEKDDISLFGKNASELMNNNASGNIVNELLLSAREISISGNTSLIVFSNKNNSSDDLLLTREMKENPEKIYQQILNQKLQRIKAGTIKEDFYIKPVPK